MKIYDTRLDLPSMGDVERDLDINKATPNSLSIKIWRDLQEVKNHGKGKVLIIKILDMPPKGRYCHKSDVDGVIQTIEICPYSEKCPFGRMSNGSMSSHLHWIVKEKDFCKLHEAQSTLF